MKVNQTKQAIVNQLFPGIEKELMADDVVVYGQFLRVVHLLAAPSSLMHPRIIWRALRWKEKKADTAVAASATRQPIS